MHACAPAIGGARCEPCDNYDVDWFTQCGVATKQCNVPIKKYLYSARRLLLRFKPMPDIFDPIDRFRTHSPAGVAGRFHDPYCKEALAAEALMQAVEGVRA
jgi:hypothetical protein